MSDLLLPALVALTGAVMIFMGGFSIGERSVGTNVKAGYPMVIDHKVYRCEAQNGQ